MAEHGKQNWRPHVIGGCIGLLMLITSIRFPHYRSLIQLCVLAFSVIYLAIVGVWEFRRRPGFTYGIVISSLFHMVVSIVLWQMLPVGIFTLVTITCIESMAVLVICYKAVRL
jgi:uncharacterized membrane protein HdeD (DUF308 family)